MKEIDRQDLSGYLGDVAGRMRFFGESLIALTHLDVTPFNFLEKLGGLLCLEAERLQQVKEALCSGCALKDVVESFEVSRKNPTPKGGRRGPRNRH